MNNIKLLGYTCVYNEADMIPYVMPYVERLGYDKFVVYDNESTDNTVELLKQYPFVEIRTYKTNGKFDDLMKRDMQLASYQDARREMFEDGKEKYVVWMTFVDFDEVLFYYGDTHFKDFLYYAYAKDRYNCFDGRIVNIFPNRNIKFNGGLIHSYEGCRCGWWNRNGKKPVLICVNSFPYIACVGGNHIMYVREREKIKNLDDSGDLHTFHLKYVDLNILDKKHKAYIEKGHIFYKAKQNDHLIEDMESASFPMYVYFLLRGFNEKITCKDNLFYYEGIKSEEEAIK